MKTNSLKTVISGSYRKHLKDLYILKNNLELMGVEVMSPIGNFALNPDEEFIYLDADPVHDKRTLQDNVFSKIRGASFLVLANFDGYIGKAALLEMGFALAFGLQVLTVELVEDPNLGIYTKLLKEVFPALELFTKQENLCHT